MYTLHTFIHYAFKVTQTLTYTQSCKLTNMHTNIIAFTRTYRHTYVHT